VQKHVDRIVKRISILTEDKNKNENDEYDGKTKRQEVTEDELSNGNDFDIDASMKRAKRDPQLAKALATSLSKWEEEMMEDIRKEFNPTYEKQQDVPPVEYPTTPPPPQPPPGSLLCELARLPSPTDICDFPFYDLDSSKKTFKLNPTTTTRLPLFQTSKADLADYTASIHLTQDSVDDWDDDECRVSEVTTYSIIADIGTYGKTFKMNRVSTEKGDLAFGGFGSQLLHDSQLGGIVRCYQAYTPGGSRLSSHSRRGHHKFVRVHTHWKAKHQV
jgi:hypothetical protein